MEQEVQQSPLLDTVSAVRDYIMHQNFKRFASDLTEHMGDTHSISVVSQFAGEGRSFLVASLAVAFTVFFEKKVVVVDTSVFERDDSPFPLLFSQIAALDPHISIEVATPDVFAGGSSHPLEFRFKHVLSALQKKFDLVLIDTTALSELTDQTIDPIVISRNCEGTLIVNSAYSLHRRIVKRLSATLRVSGVRVIGNVFMDEPR